ncbi:MAG: glycine-rich domain-containing protein [Burkholderiaceae bacterium]
MGGSNRGYGGGGGGGLVVGSGIIGKTTYTVKVGAGGAADSIPAGNGTASGFLNTANGGGGGAMGARAQRRVRVGHSPFVCRTG